MAWTPQDISDQTDRIFIITGANGGIGTATSRILASKGATVIMACRDTAKGQKIADGIDGEVRVARLDLADLASVREFAAEIGEFDVLINNAGIMNVPLNRTKDGFENQIGVNHLGHFALTGLLLDRLRDRVVTLSSVAHKAAGALRVNDLNYESRRYSRNAAYGQSKLANLIFARELQRRLTDAGSTKRAYAVHPGVSATDLFTHSQTPIDWVSKPFIALVGHSPAKAAHPALYAATSDADPHTYWGPTWFFQFRGPVGPCPSTKASRDLEAGGKLWEVSEKLTGVTYSF